MTEFFAVAHIACQVIPFLGPVYGDMKRGGGTYVLNLVPVEGGNGVDDDPRQAASKVDNLVHHERHDTGGEGVILHVQVPGGPGALKNAEVDIDLGNLLEDGVVL